MKIFVLRIVIIYFAKKSMFRFSLVSIAILSFMVSFSQHGVSVLGNTALSRDFFSSGIESLYNYDIIDEKLKLGFSVGSGINYFMANELEQVRIVSPFGFELNGGLSNKYHFEIPIIGGLSLGTKIVRVYVNGTYGLITHNKVMDDMGNTPQENVYKLNNLSAESGLKFFVPVKKNSLLILVSYKYNSIGIKVSEPYYDNYFRGNRYFHHLFKFGIGINFDDLGKKNQKIDNANNQNNNQNNNNNRN